MSRSEPGASGLMRRARAALRNEAVAVPGRAVPTPCWSCDHFRGSEGLGATSALCGRLGGSAGWTVAQPREGCRHWSPSERPQMLALVCGARDFDDQTALYRAMDHLLTNWHIVLVVHGGQTGAERLAAEWARARDIETETWTGAPAVGQVDGVIAFPGGHRTEAIVIWANTHGVPVWRPYG